jgi:hypothetical protein
VCFDCDTEYEPLEQSRRLRWKARLAERWLACKASVGLASAHDDAVATVTHRGRSCATMAALDRSGAALRRAEQRAAERRARQQEEEENATLGELHRELDRPHDDSVGTKLCPSCEFPIQKLGACLHMRCGKCAARFCWRCGAHSRPVRQLFVRQRRSALVGDGQEAPSARAHARRAADAAE